MLWAFVSLVLLDLGAWQLAPPKHLREVEDAMRELRGMDPTTIVVGSSHARTFAVLADSLAARTGGRERLLAIPVEWGKLSSYRWVLEHRVFPVLDARRAATDPPPESLRRAIIVTEWWDSCQDEAAPRNLPARSWTLRHYLADLRANGFTDYNANFLGYRFSRLFRWSALVQDRGHGRVASALRQRLVPSSEAALAANFAEQVAMWRAMVEDGAACLGAPAEMEALLAMVDAFEARGASVVVLLYPRMPVTLTDRARATTLPAFVDRVETTLRDRRVPIVDLTTVPVLSDADFGEDFDHLVHRANAKASSWMLDGPLAFLTGSGR